MKIPLSPWLILIALSVGACVPLASVHERKAKLAPLPASTTGAQQMEQTVATCEKLQRDNPQAAAGKYVEVINASQAKLRKNPKDAAAMRDYNFALARIFSLIEEGKIDPLSKPVQLPAANGGYSLVCKGDPSKPWKPSDFTLTPVDELVVGGTGFKTESKREGIGAPLVAENRSTLDEYRKLYLTSGHLYYGVTAVANCNGKQCVITFKDPLDVKTVEVAGHSYPLAADFNAATAILIEKEQPQRLGFVRMLIPDRYAYTARLSRLQPYSPNKIPVLFIHGLQDTPATWTLMVNALRADPVIRDHYQIWMFSYPSGYPYPYSAALLRHELDGVRKAFPGAKRMVIVGHSMGGLVTRMMVTDAGDKIWYDFFKKSPEETHIPAASKKTLEDALVFNRRPEVERVIFIATPHRGSEFASNWIGRIGSALIRAPQRFTALAQDTLQVMALNDPSASKVSRLPNSIDTLAPNNRFVKLMNTFPIAPGIPYHTIVGDRGRHDTPNSSDGVVPYWSSHMDGAQSEKIVPSGHSAHMNPEGIAEVDRILRLNIGKQAE